MRVVMVEDEPLARDLLRRYLAMYDDLELVGEASDGRSGLALVNETSPDVVLLDIQMPGLDGLAVARQMRPGAAVVFITAHDQHAMTAFELGAFDYLLKPVTADRLRVAMERVRERRAGGAGQELLRERLESALEEGHLRRFFVRHGGALVPVEVGDIVRLEADDDYTAVHAKGRRLLVHVPLREMAARLDAKMFVRVHRCDVVNLAHVRWGRQSERRMVLRMSDGSEVASSRAGMQALQAMEVFAGVRGGLGEGLTIAANGFSGKA